MNSGLYETPEANISGIERSRSLGGKWSMGPYLLLYTNSLRIAWNPEANIHHICVWYVVMSLFSFNFEPRDVFHFNTSDHLRSSHIDKNFRTILNITSTSTGTIIIIMKGSICYITGLQAKTVLSRYEWRTHSWWWRSQWTSNTPQLLCS